MEKEKKKKETEDSKCSLPNFLLSFLQFDIIITSVLSEVYKQGIYMKK